MNRIVVDAELRSKLLDLQKPLELCDASGLVVAHVYPCTDLSIYEPWEPVIDEAELQRREQSTARRFTTAEVLAHLEKLGNV